MSENNYSNETNCTDSASNAKNSSKNKASNKASDSAKSSNKATNSSKASKDYEQELQQKNKGRDLRKGSGLLRAGAGEGEGIMCDKVIIRLA